MFFTGPLGHHLNFGHGEHVDERSILDGTRNVSSGAASFQVEPPGCTISRRCGKTDKNTGSTRTTVREGFGWPDQTAFLLGHPCIYVYVAVADEDAHLGRVTNVHGSCVVEPVIP